MGGKRAKFQQKKVSSCDDTNHDDGGDDWLSRLPDATLVSILSALPLKEAARTSILSSRWENLWKHTLHLNFDDDTALCRLLRHYENAKIRNAERCKYINWVNKVMRSYKGFALKELRICFDLNKKSAQNAINHWLQFAFERRVERLELDLSEEADFGRTRDICALPMKKLKPHQPRSLFDSLKYLKALSFKSVDLTDQDIDVFLRSCPLLEHLVIDYALKLSNVNICGAPALKRLDIRRCFKIQSLRISAPNLFSLRVTLAVPLLLDNVPKLVVVDVTSGDLNVDKLVPALFCCLSQLEILKLDLILNKENFDDLCSRFPLLPNLKKMEIKILGRGDVSLIELTSLVRASPQMEEFVIKLGWRKLLRTERNVKNDQKHSPHQHLKVVKFLGYYGRASDVELVTYLVDNCVVLEKLIIDPRVQSHYPHAPLDLDMIDGLVVDEELPKGYQSVTVYPDEFDGLVAVQTARNYAKQQLRGQMPQHIELLIL